MALKRIPPAAVARDKKSCHCRTNGCFLLPSHDYPNSRLIRSGGLLNLFRKKAALNRVLRNRRGGKVEAAGISTVPAALAIPTGRETINSFVARLGTLIAAPKTHVYIDTSFLVWLTALGKETRGEFNAWIERVAPGRIHVPIWSAHEYLRHHVQDLHGTKLREVANDLRRVADEAFGTLRPYLDSQIANDPRSPAVVMSSVRTSLIEMKRIADAVGKWRKDHYEANAGEVIDFINRRGLSNPTMLEWMNSIETLESARFEGRIPPGFQDRGKSATDAVGSNRFGDLVLWKEILHHARECGATGVVILTNDGKNDWNMGGEEQPELDIEIRKVRSGLPPLPRPHPMLQFEARGTAGVAELMLVDRAYLAIFLRRTGEPSDRFFSAAIEVVLPSPVEEDKARRKEQLASVRPERASVRQNGAAGRAGPVHFPATDGANVADTPFALKLALTAVGRPNDDRMSPLLATMLAPESEGKGLAEFLTADTLKSWETRGVVWFGRALGSQSIDGDSLATAYATDIFSSMDRLPPRTATALYLGLLAAAYLDADEVRAVPRGPWLSQIFRLQSNPRAAIAIGAFRTYIAGREGRPVYVPDSAMPLLPVKPLLQSGTGSVPRLMGLQIGGTGVIVEAQVEVDLRLVTRFSGRDTATVGKIVGEVCFVLGIPVDQLEQSDFFEREVRFGPTVGIASPVDLRNGMGIEV